MNINYIISQIAPVLIAAIVGYVGKEAVKLIPIAIDYIKHKLSKDNYELCKNIAIDIWNKIEEDGRLGKLTTSKIETFESLIKTKLPGISNYDIELLRQSLAGEINKDKPVIQKAIEQQVQEVTLTPVIKYITPEGTELTPLIATTIPVVNTTETNTEAININPATQNTIPTV